MWRSKKSHIIKEGKERETGELRGQGHSSLVLNRKENGVFDFQKKKMASSLSNKA